MRGIDTVSNKKAKAAAAGEGGVWDVDDIELEGEKDDKVQVYGTSSTPFSSDKEPRTDTPPQDTCDEIRRKINAQLKKPGVTQAALLRHIAAQYHAAPKKPQSTQPSAFRSRKGSYAGNTSAIFYRAYVYFKKLRIKEGKLKGKQRQDIERVHAREGDMDTKHRHEWYTCAGNERPSMVRYGQLSFVQRSGEGCLMPVVCVFLLNLTASWRISWCLFERTESCLICTIVVFLISVQPNHAHTRLIKSTPPKIVNAKQHAPNADAVTNVCPLPQANQLRLVRGYR